MSVSSPRRSSNSRTRMRPASEVTRDPWNADLQEAIERELKRLMLSFTHRVSPSVAGCPTSEPQKSRRAGLSWPYGTTAKSEIRAKSNRQPATAKTRPVLSERQYARDVQILAGKSPNAVAVGFERWRSAPAIGFRKGR